MNRYRMLCSLLAGILATSASASEFYVATNGKNENPGTRLLPLASLETARDAARKVSPGPHRIIVLPGDYYLTKTLELDPRDNGLTIEAEQAGKAVLYGGTRVAGWKQDDKFWYADLPEVKEGKWDFRTLVVNGAMPPRARMPETGTFLHKSVFSVRWLSSVAGGWERKPTDEELTTLLYSEKDLPPTIQIKNAEVRVYHMWDESLCGITNNDTNVHKLMLAPPPKSPAGAFGVKKYVIFNTREGMTHPGQWYLDREAGRVFYWPLPGQDMTKAKIVAPRLERVIRISGNSKQTLSKITLRGLSIQGTTTPLKSGGFGAYAFEGALSLERVQQCALEKLEICNVGGQGIVAQKANDCRIADCHIYQTGACGIRSDGSANLITRNHIHHIGQFFPSAIALSVSTPNWRKDEKGFHIYRNEVHDAPYCGIVGGGGNHTFEENLIYRVMLELQDGGAIYGGMSRCILRGNMVRDVVKMGEGYGVSSYYLDEGSQDCIVERNVSVGVERPVHNHITRNLIIRDNVFISETNMVLSFPRSARATYEHNTMFVSGKISIAQPSAVKVWTNNVIFQSGTNKVAEAAPFKIEDAMPTSPRPGRAKITFSVPRVEQAPAIDGDIKPDEWPGQSRSMDREPSRDPASGAPAFVKVCYDDRCLYVAVTVAMFEPARLRTGTTWGKDDGAEVCIEGKTADGKPATFVVHGFACGKTQSVSDAGVPADAADKLGAAVKFATKSYGKFYGGWRSEWSIPWELLGLKPVAGQKIPFNIGVFRGEDEVWRCVEGTLGPNWKVSEAATLMLK